MISSLPADPQVTEQEFLESVRSRFEAEGFTFTISPPPTLLPDFLGSYVPDALAQRSEINIAIEVKRHPSSATEKSLQKIRRLFDGHPDWQLSVIFMGSEPLQSVTIPSAHPSAVRERIAEITSLNAGGHRRAAFMVAWSLLEAALYSIREQATNKPHTPGTVVQMLAMGGYIEPDVERQMRPLIKLRNRIVHGDLSAEPSSDDVELILSAIKRTLAAEAV